MSDNQTDEPRQTQIPALGETDLDDTAGIDDTRTDNANASSGRPYQDDLDYKDSDTDPIIDEETDSPAEELGIPESEFKDELDTYEVSDIGEGDDDRREAIEDLDEDDDNAASQPQ